MRLILNDINEEFKNFLMSLSIWVANEDRRKTPTQMPPALIYIYLYVYLVSGKLLQSAVAITKVYSNKYGHSSK